MNLNEFVNCLTSGKFDEQLSVLYGYTDMCVLRSRARYLSAAERFSRLYPKCGDIRVFSAPEYADIAGDCKILGNGSLLAAAVGRDIAAFAANNNNNNINVKFTDKSEIAVDLDDLSPKEGECGTLAAIVRGAATVLAESGAELGGLDVFVSAENDSSAIPHDVFAVLMTYVMNSFFNGGKLKRDEIAETAKKVQSEYFGVSANGIGYLLSAEGGFVFADFKNEEEPDVKPVEFDFSKAGYSLCITDTSGGETAESSTDTELGYMKSVADVLGFEKLSNAEIDDFYKKLKKYRPYIRAMEHYADRMTSPVWTCIGCSQRTYSPEFDYCYICGYETLTGYKRVDCASCGTKNSVIYDHLDIHNEGNHHTINGMCLNCDEKTEVFECPECGVAHDVLLDYIGGDYCCEGHCVNKD